MSFKKKFLQCIGGERQIESFLFFFFLLKVVCAYTEILQNRERLRRGKKVLTLWLSTANPC